MPTKTVTEKVLDANRRNSKKSTGPKSAVGKQRASLNAFKHGLAARSLQFESDEERADFERLLQGLTRDYNPGTVQEQLLVCEIATQFERSFRCVKLVEAAFRAREAGSTAILDLFLDSSFDLMDSRRCAFESSTRLPLIRAHHCSEVALRGTMRTEPDPSEFEDPAAQPPNAELFIKFASSLESLLRYEARVKRDLHRAIDQLERLQGRRGSGDGS